MVHGRGFADDIAQVIFEIHVAGNLADFWVTASAGAIVNHRWRRNAETRRTRRGAEKTRD
jgi:hypothetical protein